MTTTANVVQKKLKITFGSKHIGAVSGTESFGCGHPVFMNEERGQSVRRKNKKSETKKSRNVVIPSSGNANLYAADDLKAKPSALGTLKRKLPGAGNVQTVKRRKMDRSVTHQCAIILKHLMVHPAGWVFNRPVDPVELNIPDYFSIVSAPMDLGTIKTKLEKNMYSNIEEFAADVRLTFSNAMLYNPPSNDVHHMAKELRKVFDTRLKSLETKLNGVQTNVEQGCTSNVIAKSVKNSLQSSHKISPLHVNLPSKRLMSTEEKLKLRQQLLEVYKEKMPPNLQGFLKKCGFNWQRQGRIEVDMDAFDDETLWELNRIIRISLEARAPKAGSAKNMENVGRQSLQKIIHKGTDNGTRSASGSAKVKPQNIVAPKCGTCGGIRCQCSHRSELARTSSSDLSSEVLLGQDHFDDSKKDCDAKTLSSSQMSKLEPDSDGSASALDEEHCCSSPHLSTLATTAAPGEGWTPLLDIQLSPKKALRAAMLKSRFADTILKARQKTLLTHVDKADHVKIQQEKERLERQQREEKARIEAQIRAAEAASQRRAEAELKLQREREREAARLALQKMVKTVEIEDNLEILKDLEMISGCSLSDNEADKVVLEQLGLFRKDDYVGDADDDEEDILNGSGEEGEIFP